MVIWYVSGIRVGEYLRVVSVISAYFAHALGFFYGRYCKLGPYVEACAVSYRLKLPCLGKRLIVSGD